MPAAVQTQTPVESHLDSQARLPSAPNGQGREPASSLGHGVNPEGAPRSWTEPQIKEKLNEEVGWRIHGTALMRRLESGQYSEDRLNLILKNLESLFRLNPSLSQPSLPREFGFGILWNPALAKAFANNPSEVTGALNRLMSGVEEPGYFGMDGASEAAAALGSRAAGANVFTDSFIKDPSGFSERFVAAANGGLSCKSLCNFLNRKSFANLFEADPSRFATLAKKLEQAGNLRYGLSEDEAKLFLERPDELISVLQTIDKAWGSSAGGVMFQLHFSDSLKAAFLADPKGTADKLALFAKSGLENPLFALETLSAAGQVAAFLSDPKAVADGFRRVEALNPDRPESQYRLALDPRFVAALSASEEKTKEVLSEVGKILSRNPNPAIGNRGSSLGKFMDPKDYSLVALDYAEGRIDKRECGRRLEVCLNSSWSVAIETGRALDDLHDNPAERQKYLDSLSTAQVLGLLCSPPALFYTSSNHMLFDRMRKDLAGQDMSDVLESYGLLNSEQARNLIFRSIVFNRLEGRPNSLFKPEEMARLSGTVAGPIASGQADIGHYYLVGNALRSMGVGELRDAVGAAVRERLSGGKASGVELGALTFLDARLNGRERYNRLLSSEELAALDAGSRMDNYDRRQFLRNGKVDLLEIFDQEDTANDHFPLTLAALKKSGFHEVKKEGGLVELERADARATLFMGEPDQNIEFLRKYQEGRKNFILCFRGHSYSLDENIPADIFGNQDRRILFVPGSCGSSGALPDYLARNPKTTIQFISNSSTGRGQVTNAIIDGLLDSKRPESLQSVILSRLSEINRAGGDPHTLDTWTGGMSLLKFAMLPRFGGAEDMLGEAR